MARQEKANGHCPKCLGSVELVRAGTNHGAWALASLCTAGILLPFWFLACIKFGGWTCSKCGNRKGVKVYG